MYEIALKVLKFLFIKVNSLALSTLLKSNMTKKLQIINLCTLTGKSKALYRHYKISNIFFRVKTNLTFFFGLKKAS